MRLRPPALALGASYLEALAEEGRPAVDVPAHVAKLVAPEDASWPAWRVPDTTWWWCDGDVYLGRISLRHRLTDALRIRGGHIGYEVRPSARRRGHATAMLRAVLPHAAALGIAEVLITCDVGNVGSRRVIEACGGRLVDELDGVARYFATSSSGGRSDRFG